MLARLTPWLKRLLGRDSDPVILHVGLTAALSQQARQMLPQYTHLQPQLTATTVWGLYRELRQVLGTQRVGMVVVRLSHDAGRHSSYTRAVRYAAWLLSPLRVLALRDNGESHHLHPATAISSLLFLRGIPLDRIHLRPPWWPTHDRTVPIQSHQVYGDRPLRPLPRVAILTPYAPYPLSHGGAVRMWNLARHTAPAYEQILFTFARDISPSDLAQLLAVYARVVVFPLPRDREPRWYGLLPPEVREFRSAYVQQTVDSLMQEFQCGLLQVEFSQLIGYHAGQGTPGKDILVEHDVTFDLFRQIHAAQPGLLSWWNLYRWQRLERAEVPRYTRCIVMSQKDQQLLGRGMVIANGVDLDRFQPLPDSATPGVLFVGSFRHFPNMTAFRFFWQQVWPLVRQCVPQAQCTVVAGPDPELYWQGALPQGDGLALHAFVQDVRPLYQQAQVVVVPTLVSAGTNLKVLEAMALARPVVSTTSGVGGIPVVDGQHALIADTAPQFAEAVVQLLGDRALRQRLAVQGRQLVQDQFGWQGLAQQQMELWRKVLSQ